MPTSHAEDFYDSEEFSRNLEVFINNHYRQIAYFAYENRLRIGRGVVGLRIDDLTTENTMPRGGLLPLTYAAVDDKRVSGLSEDVLTEINDYDLDEQGILCVKDRRGVLMVPIGLARFPAPMQVYLEDFPPDQGHPS